MYEGFAFFSTDLPHGIPGKSYEQFRAQEEALLLTYMMLVGM